jgi:hypothetical protein
MKVDYDGDAYLVMKVIIVKQAISCDVLPVAMFSANISPAGETTFLCEGTRQPSGKEVQGRRLLCMGRCWLE